MSYRYFIPGIDTRALTKKIREKGTMLGKVNIDSSWFGKLLEIYKCCKFLGRGVNGN